VCLLGNSSLGGSLLGDLLGSTGLLGNDLLGGSGVCDSGFTGYKKS